MKRAIWSSSTIILLFACIVACHKNAGLSKGNYTCKCEMVEKTPPGVSPNNAHYTESYTNVTLDDAKYRCGTLASSYNATNYPTSWIFDCALE